MALVHSCSQCHRFILGQEMSGQHDHETLEAAVRARGQYSSPVGGVVGEQAHSVEERGLHGQQDGLRTWHMSRQNSSSVDSLPEMAMS